MSRASFAALIGVACAAVLAGEAAAQSKPAVTREEALARALAVDPAIGVADALRRAAEAGVDQAGRRLNPTLDLQTENVAGSGRYGGAARAETTFALSQPFELGGDRRARRASALRDLDVARASADIRQLDLIEEVEHAYIDAQAAEALARVADERVKIARDLAGAVERRVRAARDPLMAGSRAQGRLAEAEVEADIARRNADGARARLASYWGGPADFALDMASYETLADAPPASDAAPDLALAERQAARAEAQIAVERARAFPNVDVRAGLRQFRDTDDTAAIVGVSIPLNLWDRNRGGVARARIESTRAALERDVRARSLARQAGALRLEADAALREAAALGGRVIPLGEEALARAREGYAMGGFSYIDVLEAQRALVEARMRRISTLRSYHRAEASIARLGGARIEPDPLRGTQQ